MYPVRYGVDKPDTECFDAYILDFDICQIIRWRASGFYTTWCWSNDTTLQNRRSLSWFPLSRLRQKMSDISKMILDMPNCTAMASQHGTFRRQQKICNQARSLGTPHDTTLTSRRRASRGRWQWAYFFSYSTSTKFIYVVLATELLEMGLKSI